MSEGLSASAHWNQRYQVGDTPWDSGLVERELVRHLKSPSLQTGRAFEFGCGTGTNSVFLAQQGFEVAAVDCAPLAIQRAQALSEAFGVTPHLFVGDVGRLDSIVAGLEPHAAKFERSVSLLFDRGCYHVVRKSNLDGFLKVLDWLAAPSAKFLMLCGNANDTAPNGPPRVTEEQIHRELSALFEIHSIEPFRFEDRGGVSGPLGWSCWMSRRAI